MGTLANCLGKYMEVSWNRGTPKSFLFNGIFRDKLINHPFLGVHPWLWKAPYSEHDTLGLGLGLRRSPGVARFYVLDRLATLGIWWDEWWLGETFGRRFTWKFTLEEQPFLWLLLWLLLDSWCWNVVFAADNASRPGSTLLPREHIEYRWHEDDISNYISEKSAETLPHLKCCAVLPKPSEEGPCPMTTLLIWQILLLFSRSVDWFKGKSTGNHVFPK